MATIATLLKALSSVPTGRAKNPAKRKKKTTVRPKTVVKKRQSAKKVTRRKNPVPPAVKAAPAPRIKYYVVPRDSEAGFADQEKALAFAQRLANRYAMKISVIAKAS
jgi:hypothetical protein